MLEISAIVAFLIIALICFASYQNFIKEREAQIREIISKNKNAITSCRSVIYGNEADHISNDLKLIVLKRIKYSLNNIIAVSKESNLKIELEQTENDIFEISCNPSNKKSFSSLDIPKDQNETVKKIRYIKSLRAFIRSEKNNGRLDLMTHSKEDLELYVAQIKLTIETYYNAGISAKLKNRNGSARSHFEKCEDILNKVTATHEYITEKKAVIDKELREIKDCLKKDQDEHLRKIKEQEKDEFDTVFGPKRKW